MSFMKKLILSLLFVLVSHPALAHVDAGVWAGKTSSGEDCSMTVSDMFFENNVHHPLTERIPVVYQGAAFTVAHPVIVDPITARASFSHDAFYGVLPTSTGAKALWITIVHSDDFEGPVSFTYIENVWKDDTRTKVECLNIYLQNSK